MKNKRYIIIQFILECASLLFIVIAYPYLTTKTLVMCTAMAITNMAIVAYNFFSIQEYLLKIIKSTEDLLESKDSEKVPDEYRQCNNGPKDEYVFDRDSLQSVTNSEPFRNVKHYFLYGQEVSPDITHCFKGPLSFEIEDDCCYFKPIKVEYMGMQVEEGAESIN